MAQFVTSHFGIVHALQQRNHSCIVLPPEIIRNWHSMYELGVNSLARRDLQDMATVGPSDVVLVPGIVLFFSSLRSSLLLLSPQMWIPQAFLSSCRPPRAAIYDKKERATRVEKNHIGKAWLVKCLDVYLSVTRGNRDYVIMPRLEGSFMIAPSPQKWVCLELQSPATRFKSRYPCIT